MAGTGARGWGEGVRKGGWGEGVRKGDGESITEMTYFDGVK